MTTHRTHSREFKLQVVREAAADCIDALAALAALDHVLAQRHPAAGWLHHSDRGVPYACTAYIERLRVAGARVNVKRLHSSLGYRPPVEFAALFGHPRPAQLPLQVVR